MLGKLFKALSLLLVSVIIFIGVGCEDDDSVTFETDEVASNTLQALDDIESFRLEIEMDLDAEGGAPDEVIEVTMSLDGNGAADRVNREMEMGMSLDAEVTGEEDINADVDVYLVDDYIYLNQEVLGEEPMWVKLQVPEEGPVNDLLGNPQVILDLMANIIEAVELDPKGTETVKGIDCYVMEAKPNFDQLWQILMQLPGLDELPAEIPDLSSLPVDLDDLITELVFKEWIAKDTYFLTKVEVQMAVHATPEILGLPEEEGEVTASLNLSIVIYDHNEPVSIDLPAEAESAEEVSLPW